MHNIVINIAYRYIIVAYTYIYIRVSRIFQKKGYVKYIHIIYVTGANRDLLWDIDTKIRSENEFAGDLTTTK